MNNNEELFGGIFFKCVRNSSINFSEQEFNAMIPFIKNNSSYASTFVSDLFIRKKLKMYQKMALLENINLDILISNNYFNFCSKNELIRVLTIVNDKKTIKSIIDSIDIKNILIKNMSLNGIADEKKREYIEGLIIAKKIIEC